MGDSKKMRSAIMANGNFEIFEDGTVLKILKDGTKVPCKLRYDKDRGKEYPIVRYTENNKSKYFYIHRLLAEAFLPNPNNKKYVLFKNDNPKDLRLDNLVWDDGTLMIKRRSEKRNRDKVKCPECGKMIDMNIVCVTCQKQQAALKKEQQRLEKIRKKLATIELEHLDEESKKAVQMRIAGKTYSEISKELGQSYQSVYYLVKRARDPKLSKIERKHTPKKKTVSTNKKYEVNFSTHILNEEEEKQRRMYIFGQKGF